MICLQEEPGTVASSLEFQKDPVLKQMSQFDMCDMRFFLEKIAELADDDHSS